MRFFSLAKYRAERLHNQAQKLTEDGDEDGALALYRKCLDLDPDRPTSLYNVGLIYKYRNQWKASFDFNSKAYELAPSDEASRWNLAIAATALCRWEVARKAWRDQGLDIPISDEPINMNFGRTPVRLNPDEDGEVVWGRRIDPVRVIIESVPFPESGFRTNDIVLHVGAATGLRVIDGREYPVFNVLELFEPSNFSTYVAQVRVASAEQIERFLQLSEAIGVMAEDWTGNVRILCRQCSEGTPHESHDTDDGESWNEKRLIGLSCSVAEKIDEILTACRKDKILEIEKVSLELGA